MCDSRKYTFGEKLVAIATDEVRGTKWQTRRPRESGKSADFKFLLWWNQATLDKTYVIVECIGHLSIDWYLTYIEIGGSIFRYSDRSFVRLRHGAASSRPAQYQPGVRPGARRAVWLAACHVIGRRAPVEAGAAGQLRQNHSLGWSAGRIGRCRFVIVYLKWFARQLLWISNRL